MYILYIQIARETQRYLTHVLEAAGRDEKTANDSLIEQAVNEAIWRSDRSGDNCQMFTPSRRLELRIFRRSLESYATIANSISSSRGSVRARAEIAINARRSLSRFTFSFSLEIRERGLLRDSRRVTQNPAANFRRLLILHGRIYVIERNNLGKTAIAMS